MTRYQIKKETCTGVMTLQAPLFFSGVFAQKEADRLNGKYPDERHFIAAVNEMDYPVGNGDDASYRQGLV